MAKVLLIEDEDLITNLLSETLEKSGFEAETAENGREGLLKIKQTNPDIILLDIILPDISGFEILKKIKESENFKDVPVIVISNSGRSAEINRAKELGAEDWIIKTEFDPQVIINKIIKQINK